MDSNNPAFNPRTLEKMRSSGAFAGTDRAMTVEGTINKVGILVTLTIIGGAIGWSYGDNPAVMGFIGLGAILTLILSFVIIFKQTLAPTLAPVYAVLEGLLLGFLSHLQEAAYPGVVFNSFIATFGILFAMMAIYRFRIIQVTDKFRIGMSVAMFGIMAVYLVDIVMGLFGHPLPMIHQGSGASTIFSVVVIIVASLCFILDFDMIERASAARAPAYMEWYAGFSVLLTIIWLYLEILRLLGRGRK